MDDKWAALDSLFSQQDKEESKWDALNNIFENTELPEPKPSYLENLARAGGAGMLKMAGNLAHSVPLAFSQIFDTDVKSWNYRKKLLNPDAPDVDMSYQDIANHPLNPAHYAEQAGQFLNQTAQNIAPKVEFDEGIAGSLLHGKVGQGLEQLSYALAENSPQFALTAATTALGVPQASLPIIGASSAGGVYAELQGSGMDQQAIRDNAILKGTVEMAMEKYFTLPLLEEALKSPTVKDQVQQGAVSMLKNVGSGFLQEGGSEFATQVGQNAIDIITNNPQAPGLFEGSLDSLLVGGVMGSGTRALGNLSKKYRGIMPDEVLPPEVQKQRVEGLLNGQVVDVKDTYDYLNQPHGVPQIMPGITEQEPVIHTINTNEPVYPNEQEVQTPDKTEESNIPLSQTKSVANQQSTFITKPYSQYGRELALNITDLKQGQKMVYTNINGVSSFVTIDKVNKSTVNIKTEDGRVRNQVPPSFLEFPTDQDIANGTPRPIDWYQQNPEYVLRIPDPEPQPLKYQENDRVFFEWDGEIKTGEVRKTIQGKAKNIIVIQTDDGRIIPLDESYPSLKKEQSPDQTNVKNIELDEKNLTPSGKIAYHVKLNLTNGVKMNWIQLFNISDQAFGGKQSEGRYTPKDAYDAMELGINQYLLENNDLSNTNISAEQAKSAIDQIENSILQNIPTQTKRTAEQDEFQQFSTPPNLAYLANWVANISDKDTVLEPSAGVGGLAVFAKANGAKVIVNELSEGRANLLKEMILINCSLKMQNNYITFFPTKLNQYVVVHLRLLFQ